MRYRPTTGSRNYHAALQRTRGNAEAAVLGKASTTMETPTNSASGGGGSILIKRETIGGGRERVGPSLVKAKQTHVLRH